MTCRLVMELCTGYVHGSAAIAISILDVIYCFSINICTHW